MRRLKRRPRHLPAKPVLWIPAAAVVCALAGAVPLLRTPFGEALSARLASLVLDGTAALGFAVADIRVEGRGTTDRATILEALAAGRGTPILGVDLARAKHRLEALPWVRSAAVVRRLPDTLYVRLVERKPLALWQHAGRIELIDRDGSVIRVTRLDRFAKLPLVVGEDAAGHAAGLIDMLASEPALYSRVSACVRVGGRRWNVRIDDAIDVLLPEAEAARAWARLARLEASEKLLERRVEAVDMRLPDRLVLRVEPQPAPPPAAKKARPQAKNT